MGAVLSAIQIGNVIKHDNLQNTRLMFIISFLLFMLFMASTYIANGTIFTYQISRINGYSGHPFIGILLLIFAWVVFLPFAIVSFIGYVILNSIDLLFNKILPSNVYIQ